MIRMRFELTGLAAAALLLAGGCGGEGRQRPAPAPGPGAVRAAAPRSEAVTDVAAMEVLDLDGLRADIAASGAKVTVVALWATWCAPCIEEMPGLSRFYEAHRAEGLRVVGLCTDDRADMDEQIQEVLDKAKVAYKQALLKPGSEAAFFEALGHRWDGQLPKTVVFDATGRELAYLPAAVDDKVLADKVAPLLQRP